jgi:PPOX class probable F420-dependent enzyme
VDVETALDFARSHHRAVLATMRRDGTPQMSPVLAVANDDGRVLISSRETAMKTRNVRRDPRAWLCVLTNRFFGDWVQMTGTVDVVSLPEAMDLLVDYYRRAVGEHEDWEEYRSAMQRERRCVLRVTVTDAGPTVSG